MSTEAKAPKKTRGLGKSREPIIQISPARECVQVPSGVEILLSRAQVCAALGMSLRKLQTMLSAGDFPTHDLRVGANPRWKAKTLNDWVEARCAAKGG